MDRKLIRSQTFCQFWLLSPPNMLALLRPLATLWNLTTAVTHQEMTSDSVTVFARLANMREGVKTVKTTCQGTKTCGIRSCVVNISITENLRVKQEYTVVC